MAATPTEVLNEDIKDLRGDLRENRTKIDLVKEEVQRLALAQAGMKIELHQDIQELALAQATMRTELRDDIHRIALAQAEMKGQFRFVKLLLSLVLAGIVGSLWQFYRLDARVNNLESRFDRLETKVNDLESRFDRLDASVGKILELLKTPTALPAPKVSAATP